MSLFHLLSNDGFIVVNKLLIKKIGFKNAYLLGELIAEHNYWESNDKLDDGWFYSTVENVENNTSLSKYEQSKAITEMSEMGLVEYKFKGIPPKRYIKINEKSLETIANLQRSKNLTYVGQKISPIKVKNFDTNNNKEIKITNKNKGTTTSELERVLELWNSIDGLNHIRDIKGTRLKHLNNRIAEEGIDAVIEVIENVGKSDFLKGNNKNGWRATFDWIILPSNFSKVLEGNYNSKSNEQSFDDELARWLNDR